jgi:tricorn protease-like protein
MKQIKQIKYNSVVRCLKYSPDKKNLVVGAYDKIRILDENYELIKEIEHKITEFQQICFNNKGDQMAAIHNGLLKIFNSSNFTVIRTLQL